MNYEFHIVNRGMNYLYFLFIVKNKRKTDNYVEFLCGAELWLILSVNVNVSPKVASLGHLFSYVKTSDDSTKVQSLYISTIEIAVLWLVGK